MHVGAVGAPRPVSHAHETSPTASLAAAVAAAVGHQVGTQLAALSRRIDEQAALVRQAGEQMRAHVQAEIVGRLDVLTRRVDEIDSRREVDEVTARAVQTALEGQLRQLADIHDERFGDLEQLPTEVAVQMAATAAVLEEDVRSRMTSTAASIIELRRSAQQIEAQTDERTRRVAELTTSLGRRIDDTMAELDARLAAAREESAVAATALCRQVADQLVALDVRIDGVDAQLADALIALEQRIDERSGVQVAALEASLGRAGDAFDEAVSALSLRLDGAEEQRARTDAEVAGLAGRVANVDDTAIGELREQMSRAVGEAMLVRIEMDRMSQGMEQQLDRHGLRMGEIEALISDHMDTGTAVQLDRLDELERAVAELDPDQFVRRSAGHRGTTADGRAGSDQPTPSGPAG
ncbi:MAG: hypothetical protein JWM12_569 [Ilumatobacteraceae bacterium]|nr:hypothetical protein [Ilumatobacteraceae bacterium]